MYTDMLTDIGNASTTVATITSALVSVIGLFFTTPLVIVPAAGITYFGVRIAKKLLKRF